MKQENRLRQRESQLDQREERIRSRELDIQRRENRLNAMENNSSQQSIDAITKGLQLLNDNPHISDGQKPEIGGVITKTFLGAKGNTKLVKRQLLLKYHTDKNKETDDPNEKKEINQFIQNFTERCIG